MIRNYENPAGTAAVITSTATPVLVFTSTTSGAPVGGSVVERRNAITTMALCNTNAPNPADETLYSIAADIHLVRKGITGGANVGNKIVSQLTIPAGETVFLSEERIVLENGDMIYITVSASGLAVTVSALEV